MTNPPPLPKLPLGEYEHYKGGRYKVLAVAYHSETLEPMVVYHTLDGDRGTWVRPFAMFIEKIKVDGKIRQRFKYIGNKKRS